MKQELLLFFFTRLGSKLNICTGKAACTAGTGSREEDLAPQFVSKFCACWKSGIAGGTHAVEGAGVPAGAVAQCPPGPARAQLPPCRIPATAAKAQSDQWEGQEPQDALGYGLVEFPQLLLLRKSPFSPWKTNLSHFFVLLLVVLVLSNFLCFVSTVHPTGRAPRKALLSKKKEKKPFSFHLLPAGSSQNFPPASRHLCSFCEKQRKWDPARKLFSKTPETSG